MTPSSTFRIETFFAETGNRPADAAAIIAHTGLPAASVEAILFKRNRGRFARDESGLWYSVRQAAQAAGAP